MTNPDLAALSEAATQGEWSTGYSLEGNYLYAGEHHIACISSPADNGKGGDNFIRGESEAVANTDLIVALVNVYRSGDLVPIDREGMREREQAFLQDVWEALKGDHNDLRRETIILRAYRSAITAILGEKP